MTNHENIDVKSAGARRADPNERDWCYRPPIDVVEDADAFTLLVDLPGADPECIDVAYEEQKLRIRAAVPPRPESGVDFLMNEYGVADFRRDLALPHAIDAQRIGARFEHGVLTIELPKAAEAKPRRIPVISD